MAVAPWGHLIVCKDRYTTNHLRGITPDGLSYAIARHRGQGELASVCFSPDGAMLFVNI